MNRKQGIILAILFLLILIGIDMYIVRQWKRGEVNDNLAIYTNSELGFEVQYPKDWHIGSENSEFDEVGYDLDLSICPGSLYLGNSKCKYEQSSPRSGRSLAPILLYVLNNKADSTHLYFENNSNSTFIQGSNYKYELVLMDPLYRSEYDQVASSFKLLGK